MRLWSKLILRGFILSAFAIGVASAQTIPFQLFATENGNSATVANDSQIDLSTTVGTKTTVTIKATYIGNSVATIANQPQLIGSTQITFASQQTPPLMLNPGDSYTFTVTYAPTTTIEAQAQLTIVFTEPGTTGAPVQNQILLSFVGTTPAFTLSYILQNENNVVQIPPGGTIPFGAIQINTTSSANLDINNTGSGAGVITGITPPAAGSPFKLQGIPLLPFQVASGAALQLLVQYAPTAVESDTGQITITYQGGATATVN